MKIEYTCETCGKRYSTPAEANACEAKHKEEKKKAALKKEAESAINSLINQYVKTYKAMPLIKIDDDNMECLISFDWASV